MSGPTPRLSLDTLGRVGDVAPRYDPRTVEVGMVHLGIGAFFRAHQAAYADAVIAGGHAGWGICGFSQRSPRVPEQLRPQHGLYGMLLRDSGGPPQIRVIGALREVHCAADEPATVVERIAAPTTHVVTLTVTEKGYRQDPVTGGLRDDEEVRADLDGGEPRTVIGQIVRGLQRRLEQGGAPIAIMSCDNLTRNGGVLERLAVDFIERLPGRSCEPLLAWLTAAVRFPSTMVDRIVPATTEADRAEAQRHLGVRDEALVVAEPFTQWVIEDTFLGPRPPWESVGATLSDDVAGHERVKLRLLNAAHSLLAYLGVLAGHETIADAVRDEHIRAAVQRLLHEDQAPTVTAPGNMNLETYAAEVLRRFANPALRHTTAQVAMDGSQKLPQRLLGAVRDSRASGHLPRHGALLIAAWIRAVEGVADDGRREHVQDPLGDQVRALLAASSSAADAATAVLGLSNVFGHDLVEDRDLIAAVAEWLAALRLYGVSDTLAAQV